jgi:hypothetical protein
MLAGDFEAGSDLAAKLLALNPNSSEAWAVQGDDVRLSERDTKTSLDHFERARRLSPLEFHRTTLAPRAPWLSDC